MRKFFRDTCQMIKNTQSDDPFVRGAARYALAHDLIKVVIITLLFFAFFPNTFLHPFKALLPAHQSEPDWHLEVLQKDLKEEVHPLLIPGDGPWPPLEIDLGSLNTPPMVPPIPLIGQSSPSGSPTEKEMYDRLIWLVESLPNSEFQSAIGQAGIGISFLAPGDHAMGRFSALGENHPARKSFPHLSAPVPLLGVNRQSIQSMTSDQDVIALWLTMYHEGVHLEQFTRGAAGTEMLVKELTNQPSLDCQAAWDIEYEAYTRTCDLAFEWGVPTLDVGVFCLYKDQEDVLSRWLLAYFIELEFTPACHEEWLATNK